MIAGVQPQPFSALVCLSRGNASPWGFFQQWFLLCHEAVVTRKYPENSCHSMVVSPFWTMEPCSPLLLCVFPLLFASNADTVKMSFAYWRPWKSRSSVSGWCCCCFCVEVCLLWNYLLRNDYYSSCSDELGDRKGVRNETDRSTGASEMLLKPAVAWFLFAPVFGQDLFFTLAFFCFTISLKYIKSTMIFHSE